MEVTMSVIGNIPVAAVKGEVVAENVTDLKKILGDLLATDRVKVVLDFEQMDYIDSSGLAALISRSNDFRKKRGDLHLAAMNDTVRKAFDVTFLSRHFRIFPTVEEALKAF